MQDARTQCPDQLPEHTLHAGAASHYDACTWKVHAAMCIQHGHTETPTHTHIVSHASMHVRHQEVQYTLVCVLLMIQVLVC